MECKHCQQAIDEVDAIIDVWISDQLSVLMIHIECPHCESLHAGEFPLADLTLARAGGL